ncbi:hypothetical protein ASPZODRAFT_13776 [Penicilliopsis zonata CBS 506.65]|uniref:Uncharacterized protein n=1 Tax=Penicilliopsis zonata CBS 506.65 TaxID=1073090 RepID=A0A1L9SP41_9EURO|nr:hypothetical protein ASPZODRAFT_13776 [Penicilliopsis zonata CBS 506.65]OJJ49039.1 hypothetical protein ASPZODRAFT_13776 [Penicilliopsis zonata CBS 506.65]
METSSSSIPLRPLSRGSLQHPPGYDEHDHRQQEQQQPSATGEQHAESTVPPMETLPPYSHAPPPELVSGRGYTTTLRRSRWVLLLTLLYLILAVYSWVITVILSYRPLYGFKSWQWPASVYWDDDTPSMAGNDRVYRSARVIQSIVSVVTLPWISAVCASAAVIFVQKQKSADALTLRQVMTLADRRWMDPTVWYHLTGSGGGSKRYTSSFLLGAMCIYLAALVTYPIQSIFLTSQTITVPKSPFQVANTVDFTQIDSVQYSDASGYPGVIMLIARNSLSSATTATPQYHLWQSEKGGIVPTFLDISSLTDPFYCPLPVGLNTGQARQFAPRINSTATSTSITEDDWPSDCNSSSKSGFYFHYSSANLDTEYDSSFDVVACMLDYTTTSPWTATRKPQNFSETLYLNLTQQGYSAMSNVHLYKITVKTTAGYFELPNYMNDLTPGPLLDEDFASLCGTDCPDQNEWLYVKRADTTNDVVSSDWNALVETQINPGPLLTTAAAIFGPSSFIETWPSTFAEINASLAQSVPNSNNICLELPPLQNLLLGEDSYSCQSFDSKGTPSDGLMEWIYDFLYGSDNMANAFTAAALLANQAWFQTLDGQLYVYKDFGTDVEVPSISLAGIVVVSALMGLYMIPLLLLAIYSSLSPRWTSQLDSFAMLRMGAAIGEKSLPFLVGRNMDAITVLDELPGVVQNVASPASEGIEVGHLGLGPGKRLMSKVRYEAFEGDDEDWNQSERNIIFLARNNGGHHQPAS